MCLPVLALAQVNKCFMLQSPFDNRGCRKGLNKISLASFWLGLLYCLNVPSSTITPSSASVSSPPVPFPYKYCFLTLPFSWFRAHGDVGPLAFSPVRSVR